MRIVPAAECDFDALAFAAENGGVLHQPGVRSLGQEDVELCIVLDESGQAFGAFNLQRIRLKGFASIAQPQFHPHCALFTLPVEGKIPAVVGRRKRVLECLATYLDKRSEKIISLPLPTEWKDVQPLSWAGFNCSVRYTYQLDLRVDEPLEAMSSKLSGHLRRAREQLQLKDSVEWEDFIRCIASTAEHQGFSLRNEALSALFKTASTQNGCVIGAARDEEVVAAGLFVNDSKVMYYLMGALDRSHKERGALSLVIAHAIYTAKSAGCKVFDFEGSMIPGVEQFFRMFGGSPQPYYVAAKAPGWLRILLRMRGRNEF